MAFQGLRRDHCLEGASNLVPWKGRIMIVLEDNGVGEFVKQSIPPPQDPQQLTQHTKNDIKARRIILEGVRDHIVPHIHEKKTTFEMCKTILELYQSTDDTRRLALMEKLRSIRMRKDESIVTYFKSGWVVQGKIVKSPSGCSLKILQGGKVVLGKVEA